MKKKGRYESIHNWFVSVNGQENEAGKLFDATNEIIRRITRYATQLNEKNAMVFGIERPYHLRGDSPRETESMNRSVYEEGAIEFTLKPRIRTYREKSKRSSMKDNRQEKEEMRSRMLKQLQEERKKLEQLEVDGRIDFSTLPVIEPRVREILLKWLSDALEDGDYSARTDDGRLYVLDMSHVKEPCVVHCEDGNFTMPKLSIVFQEEV